MLNVQDDIAASLALALPGLSYVFTPQVRPRSHNSMEPLLGTSRAGCCFTPDNLARGFPQP